MAIEKSDIFHYDTLGKVLTSVPLVVIYKGIRPDNFDEIDSVPDSDKLFISTQNIFFDGNYYEPLLSKIPSVKQSIDTEGRNFRLKTATIDIINTSFHGRTFSDNVKDIINCAVRVYYKTQSCKTLDDCMLISQSAITRYKQRKNNLQLELEDLSEVFLSKEIPELTDDSITYEEQERLKAIPVIYGKVEKCPLIKLLNTNEYQQDGTQAVRSLLIDRLPVRGIFDSQAYTNTYPSTIKDWYVSSSIYIYDEDYLNLMNYVPDRYAQEMDIDTSLPFFEFSNNKILITDAYNEFENQVVSSDIFGSFFTGNATMSRILRAFKSAAGGRRVFKDMINDSYGSAYPHSAYSILFATHQHKFMESFRDGGSDWIPQDLVGEMYTTDGWVYRWTAVFPFESDRYDQWNSTLNFTQPSISTGTGISDSTLPAWNVNETEWELRPRDYARYVNQDNNYALGWAGSAHQQNEESWVYWDLQLDEVNVGNKCLTWFTGEITHYINPYIEYGNGYEDADFRWVSGSAIWGDTADIPRLHYTAHRGLGTSGNGETWWNVTDGSGGIGDYVENSWSHWNTFLPVSGGPQENRTETWHVDGDDNRHVATCTGEFVPEWNSINQLKSIRIGRPKYIQQIEQYDDHMQFNCGSVNYMFFIQDAIIENPNQKNWYANVFGRYGDLEGPYDPTAGPQPFNQYNIQIMPTNIITADTETIDNWLDENGYGQYGGGGSDGWLINCFQLSTSLGANDHVGLWNYIPDNIVFRKLSDGGVYKWDPNTQYFFDEDGTPQDAFDPSDAGVFFTDATDVVSLYEPSSAKPRWIRQTRLAGGGGNWDEIDNDDAVDYVENLNFNDDIEVNEGYNGEGSYFENPVNILRDLIVTESEYSENNFEEEDFAKSLSAHQGWKLGFAINEQETLKKLVEEISSNTKLYPRFSTTGKFSFSCIDSIYNASDIDFHIKKHEIVEYKFSYTKIEETVAKQGVFYHYDYETDDYNKVIDKDSIETEADSYNTYRGITKSLYGDGEATPDQWNYEFEDTYNMTLQEASVEFEAKYIREKWTAEQLRKYLLLDNINQHLVIDLTLTNKYVGIEIGDIIYLDQLDKDLAFGQKYWAFEAKNGQLIYPFYFVTSVQKINNRVKVKLRRLHRLQYGMPLWAIQNAQTPPYDIYPDNFDAISQVTDDGKIYNSSQSDVTTNYDPKRDTNDELNTQFIFDWQEPKGKYLDSEDNNSNYDSDLDTYVPENGNIIKVDISQSIMGGDPQHWKIEFADSYDDFGTWYGYGDSYDTEYFNSWNVVKWDEYDYSGMAVFIPKSENNDGYNRVGKMRITTDSGTVIEETFYQKPSEDSLVENLGDINLDGVINILDVVRLVNFVLDQITPTEEEIILGDINGDGGLNILDIVMIVNMILED